MDTSTVELPPHEEESALDDALLCFDNPLLDIRVCVNEDFLRQKNLGKNDMVIAQAEHMPMFREILTDPIFENSRILLPGGSGLNTARAAAWCCRRLLSDFDGASSKRVAFVGTIAQDANGKLLKEISEADGVTFHATYPSHSTQPQCSHQDEEEAKIATTLNATSHASHEVPWTGACAVLVSGHHRSLVTHLGASAFFDSSSLVQNLEIQQEVQRSSLLYVTGFFLRTTPETCTMLAQLSQEHAVPSRNGGTGVKRVALNLSAPFIVKSCTKLVISFLEHTTFLFGNREEFMTLCHAANWFSSEEEGELVDIEVVLRKTLSFMAASSTAAGSNTMLRNGNHIIMTNGEHEVIVCRGWKDCVREAKILRHAIKSLPLSALVDTNGAGDAFVGGYLATYLMLGDGCYSGDAVEQIAVECAMYMSAICVCSPGSILPVNSVQPPGSPMIIQSTGQFKEQIARLIRDDRELQ